ncbi:MAG: glycosyltransferase, partial [Deltaproteobacteria bacterium]|nr:glycosyltransferase [Deltaproteobacteria bacterium]
SFTGIELKPGLKQKAFERELNNCIFIDPIPKAQLAELLKQCHVGMMILDNVPAFYYGTSPNKFFDYISSGLPILNNYHGWLKEIITQNQCGVAVLPENPEAFANALIELADHPEKRKEMGINARKLAISQFARQDLSDSLVSFLEKVCDG